MYRAHRVFRMGSHVFFTPQPQAKVRMKKREEKKHTSSSITHVNFAAFWLFNFQNKAGLSANKPTIYFVENTRLLGECV